MQAQLAERTQEIARVGGKVQRLQGERQALMRTLADTQARLRRLKVCRHYDITSQVCLPQLIPQVPIGYRERTTAAHWP